MNNFLQKVSWKAVITGSIVDVGGTSIVGLFLLSYIEKTYNLETLPYENYVARVQEVTLGDPSLFLISFIIGVSFSVLGGYIAARIAKRSELLNGTLSSFACISLGVYTLLTGLGSMPIILELLLLPLSPLLALGGGYLYKIQSKKI